MKKHMAAVAITLGLGFSSLPVAAGQVCANGVVTAVRTGGGSSDAGNYVEARVSSTGSKWWQLSDWYNLNDSPGYAHFQLLVASKLTGSTVTLTDERSKGCWEFDSVTLE